ncbi:MAG: DMT family transporter [Patescibacteria group bacterium]|nr:DMT family transporter [Patescibacteria group bacterium]|tara:strand:- start:18157 stop:19047 length:891 start_codon:yes stop_codon:yes gene_type:complete
MNWIIIVLAGHFLNAFAFLMDKFLLTKKIPSPFVYAFFIGVLGILALVLIPFGVIIPSSVEIIRALIAGATFIIALVFFFAGLKENEASRVVPLTGGFVPAFTFVLAYFFLAERLGQIEILAFAALVIGGVLITLDRNGKGNAKGYMYAVIAALIFAISFVITKQVFIEQAFISGFVWSRIGGFLMALSFLLIPSARHGILHQPKQKNKGSTAVLFFTGQATGALGFVLVNYAISLASVSLVNAMQGVQYAFLLVMVLILSKKFPKILSEKLSGGALMQKVIAIILISIGIILIAF